MDKKVIENALGERYIGVGLENGKIEVKGIAGNAMGSYLSGGEIEVFGNVQDECGDTMGDGKIIIHGNAGDALGLSMRGGKIYIKGDTGYRAGIHMKEYKDKAPCIIIGKSAGSFLGEYMAGGMIILLDYDNKSDFPDYIGCGMHGGKIIIKSDKKIINLPTKVSCNLASKKDIIEISEYLKEFCLLFSLNESEYLDATYQVITPDCSDIYNKSYVSEN